MIDIFEKFSERLDDMYYPAVKKTNIAILKLWRREPLNNRDKRLLNRLMKKLGGEE